MKKLIVLFLMLSSFNANATMNMYGDMVSGSVSLPSSGAVIVQSDAFAFQGPDHDFYSLTALTTCTLGCTLEVGIFDGSGNPVKTYLVNQGAGTQQTSIPHVVFASGQKFEVRTTAGNLGTISATMNLSLINED